MKIALICEASDESELVTIARQLASLENRVRQIEEGFLGEIEVEEVIHGELAEMFGRIDSDAAVIPGTSGAFAVNETVHVELLAMLGGMTESAEGEKMKNLAAKLNKNEKKKNTRISNVLITQTNRSSIDKAIWEKERRDIARKSKSGKGANYFAP